MNRKSIAVGIVAFVALLASLGVVLPKEITVVRSLDIAAPVEHIYPDLAAASTWPEWTVWSHKNDPTYEAKIVSDQQHGAGTVVRFSSKNDASGQLTFVAADPRTGLTYRVEIPEADITTRGEVRFEPSPAGTKVTWSDTVNLREAYFPRYFSPFVDGVMGGALEENLRNLKERSERRAMAASRAN